MRFTIVVAALLALTPQMREQTICGGNIVSPVAVSTYCGHRDNGDEILDLLVLWRGAPGWFAKGGSAGGGGGTSGGSVFQYSQFGDVSVGVDIDRAANRVKIGQELVPLDAVNVVLVDDVGGAGGYHIVGTRWIEPRLSAEGNPALQTVQRSTELIDYLR
ncbi:MAG TPA: hypothetical protein VFA59_22560, partial [Vicinamibacterales bacterium]|nr:hypothetical protein [Vicinamibacterales bacterium]